MIDKDEDIKKEITDTDLSFRWGAVSLELNKRSGGYTRIGLDSGSNSVGLTLNEEEIEEIKQFLSSESPKL